MSQRVQHIVFLRLLMETGVDPKKQTGGWTYGSRQSKVTEDGGKGGEEGDKMS